MFAFVFLFDLCDHSMLRCARVPVCVYVCLAVWVVFVCPAQHVLCGHGEGRISVLLWSGGHSPNVNFTGPKDGGLWPKWVRWKLSLPDCVCDEHGDDCGVAERLPNGFESQSFERGLP